METVKLTPAKADKLIKSGNEVTLYSAHFCETVTVVIVKRDRWMVYTQCGMTLDRSDFEIVLFN